MLGGAVPSESGSVRPQVVVLGGGFGGLGAARKLKHANADVVLHLTLLSAWEDRTKAMVDWTWGGFTHERSGRILVGQKEK